MNLSQSDLLKIMQEQELHILEKCIEVCATNNIQYFALGGTLLGAARHSGFIPWDDDVDLGMPRNDYERFIVIMKQLEHESGLLVKPNPKNYDVLQITANNPIDYKGKQIEAFIDIFPLDGYPSSRIGRLLHSKRILWNRLLYKISVIDQVDNVDRGLVENLIVTVSRGLRLNKLFDTKKISQHIHRIIQRYPFEESALVGNILGRYRDKEIVPKSYFGKGAGLPFHHLTLTGPESWSQYLEQIYGDYMKLPPEAERLAHFEVSQD